MGRDDTDATKYKLFWSWDSTDLWTGTGQTGDACALFDYNGNTNIDAVVCGPGDIAQAHTRDEFVHRERLDHVIVSAHVEGAHAVVEEVAAATPDCRATY